MVVRNRRLTTLPCAFARRPLDTCAALIGLSTAYRDQADKVLQTADEELATALLDAALKIESSIIGLWESCDRVDFEKLTQPSHGDCLLLKQATVCRYAPR